MQLSLLLLSGYVLLSHVVGQDYNISESFSFQAPPDVSLEHGQRKLIQLHFLFRHGMRAPDQSFPTNPNPDAVWREGLGKLTQHGKYQQYALGQYLRGMYRNFITPSPVEIEVLSSQRNRCVLSALSNVAALTKPDDKWEFVPGLPWQPVPVLYAAHGKDRYLGKVFDCPKAKREVQRMAETGEGRKFIKAHKELFEYWAHNSKLAVKTWTEVSTLYDILSMHKTYNHIVPEWATTHWDQLQEISDLSFYFASKSKDYQRLRAGPLLDLMKSKMEARIRGSSQKKVHMYSGHSKNMVAVLSALDVFNRREPPFCATLIIELYQESHGHSVRLLFLNSTTPENGDQVPHLLQLPKCEEYCPFRIFDRLVEDLTPLDWVEECHEV